jgi:hypothetical protein
MNQCISEISANFILFCGGGQDWDLNLELFACKVSTLPVHFALVILELGSLKLFAQAGLEPRSS